MKLHKDGCSAVLNIALEKEGDKKKKQFLQHGYSYLVTHPSTKARSKHRSIHAPNLTDELSMAEERCLNQFGSAD